MGQIQIGHCLRSEEGGGTISDARGRCAACSASKVGDERLCRSCRKAKDEKRLDERLARLARDRESADRRAVVMAVDRPPVVEVPAVDPVRNFLSADELARLLVAKEARNPKPVAQVRIDAAIVAANRRQDRLNEEAWASGVKRGGGKLVPAAPPRKPPLETTGAATSTAAGVSSSRAHPPLLLPREKTPPSSSALTPLGGLSDRKQGTGPFSGSSSRRLTRTREESRAQPVGLPTTRSSGDGPVERSHPTANASTEAKSTTCSQCAVALQVLVIGKIEKRLCPKHMNEALMTCDPQATVRVAASWEKV